MTLTLDISDFDQCLLADDARAAQQRPGNGDFVVARELPYQRARRVGDQRHSLGKLDTRGELGVWNEIDQQTVDQIDVIGFEPRGVLEEQLRDRPRGLSAALGIAMPDDFIEPGDQRRGGCHQHTQNRRVA